jgi:hypothetical protein
MDKVLIAVETCHQFNYDMRAVDDCMILYRGPEMDFTTPRTPAIRATWWKDIPPEVDKRFFFGMPTLRQPLEDEIFLAVADDYVHLPYKTKAICQWAVENKYDWMFKADDDTFLYVNRILSSDFKTHPWTGRYNGGEFIAGGPGYWLNADAMRVVASASVNIKNEWAEDKWASNALLRAGFKPNHDSRYVDFRRGTVDSSTVAVCECTRDKMISLYEGKV